ncbi:hypothetical protein CHL67_11410 [Prosthecochloris sp. GSB1]|nr:hypothetical protein CHL67_11410 [Prosthecochloris sp. GSB1]
MIAKKQISALRRPRCGQNGKDPENTSVTAAGIGRTGFLIVHMRGKFMILQAYMLPALRQEGARARTKQQTKQTLP